MTWPQGPPQGGQPPQQPYGQQPQQSPYGQQPKLPQELRQLPPQQPGAGALTLDVWGDNAKSMVPSAAVAGVLGVGLVIFTLVKGYSTGETIGGVLVGLLCIGLGLMPVAMMTVLKVRQRFTLNPHGITWEGPKDASWTIGWNELNQVAVSKAVKRNPSLWMRFLDKTLVRIDFLPGQGFQERHPELAKYWEHSGAKGCYRVPIGKIKKYVQVLDGALRIFVPQKYIGVIDEGIAWGLRYS